MQIVSDLQWMCVWDEFDNALLFVHRVNLFSYVNCKYLLFDVEMYSFTVVSSLRCVQSSGTINGGAIAIRRNLYCIADCVGGGETQYQPRVEDFNLPSNIFHLISTSKMQTKYTPHSIFMAVCIGFVKFIISYQTIFSYRIRRLGVLVVSRIFGCCCCFCSSFINK